MHALTLSLGFAVCATHHTACQDQIGLSIWDPTRRERCWQPRVQATQILGRKAGSACKRCRKWSLESWERLLESGTEDWHSPGCQMWWELPCAVILWWSFKSDDPLMNFHQANVKTEVSLSKWPCWMGVSAAYNVEWCALCCDYGSLCQDIWSGLLLGLLRTDMAGITIFFRKSAVFLYNPLGWGGMIWSGLCYTLTSCQHSQLLLSLPTHL